MPSNPSFINSAFITGATSGLGKGLAYFLAEKNIPLIVTGKNQEQLDILKRDLQQKVPIEAISADLANPQERKKLLKIISEKKPNLVINNAGFGLYGDAIDFPLEQQLQMIEVNVTALVEISLHTAATMKKNAMQATILNISSAASFFPFPLFTIYSASKSFVNSFSLGLDTELRDFGIRVLCACPGQIETSFRLRASQGHPQKKDNRTMTIQQAVLHLWKQIQEQKRLYIFNGRYHFGIWLFRLLPPILREKIFMKNIRKRKEFRD